MVKPMQGAEERVVEIFRLRGAPEEAVRQIRKAFTLYRLRHFDKSDLYDFVVGVSWNYKVPLTPREVSEIRRLILGE